VSLRVLRSRALRAALLGAAMLMPAGCAYKPLKAPCSADEGVPPGLGSLGAPLPYAEVSPSLPEPFRSRTPASDADGHGTACGPMRPI
jgi:hypothetical protein